MSRRVAPGLDRKRVPALPILTLQPTQFPGRAAEYGSIRAGKRADLVLVDGSSLESIRRVRHITLVSVDGRLYDRAALDLLLAYTEAHAASWSLGCKTSWRVLRSLAVPTTAAPAQRA